MKTDVTTHLMKKSAAISQGAELLASSINDWQMIRQFLTNRVAELELTPTQREKLQRYNFIYDQLASGNYIDAQVVHLVAEKYGVTTRQAYEDIICSKEVYTHVLNFNKAFEIRLQLNLNRKLLTRAMDAGRFDEYAMLERNRVRLIALLPDIEEGSNWFEPHENVIEFNPELIGAPAVDTDEVLKYIEEKRKAKLKTALFEEAEVIDPHGNQSPPL